MLRRCAVAGAALLCSSFLYSSQPHSALFEWGNGVYRQRPGHPEDILNFNNFTIKRVATFSDEGSPPLKHVSFGPVLTAAIDVKGDLHVYQKHEINNVKLEEVDDAVRQTKVLQEGGKYVSSCFTTKGVLFALNERGEVWQWRFDKDPSALPRRIPLLTNIKQIAAGTDHFVALDKEGRVWSMGDDTYGQCGIAVWSRQYREPYLELRYPNPQVVSGLPGKVKEIACGAQHTIAVLENGDAYGWGRNDKRQLGPTEVTISNQPLPVCYEPVPMIALGKFKVTKVTAGDWFSLFVTENGEVYGSGVNTRGQLGAGFLNHINDSILITGLSNFVVMQGNEERQVKVKEIACGSEHCLALLDVNAVYSWGGNEHGEQANKKRTITDRPTLVKHFRDYQIDHVFAGKYSSAVIATPIPPKSA